MKRSALLFILPALILSSCGGDNPPANKDDCYASYELAASIRKADTEKTGGYNLSFHYKSEYFEKDATVFDKELALLSSGMSMMAESEATIKNFYNSVHFDQIEAHYVEHTKDSVCYALASRKYEDYDLISVVVNGYNYGLEWANNALVGTSGDHEGFSSRANDIYASLKTFVADHTNYKLWISGYSRGGAIANVLSHYILSKGEIEIAQKDMFVYTFECPKGLDKDNAPEYPNVFNVLYSGDLVTYVGPSEYGFARCGKDIDLYQSSSHTYEVIHAFDEDIDIKEFVPFMNFIDTSVKVETEQEAAQMIVSYIVRDGTDGESFIYFPTREDFVNKGQHTVQTVMSIFFGLREDIKAELIQALKENILSISSPQQMCDLIKPYLDRAEFPYVESELLADCGVIMKLMTTDFAVLLAIYMAGPEYDGVMHAIRVHYPEVGYALLADYNPDK